MEVLVGDISANWFLTIFKHHAALHWNETPAALQMADLPKGFRCKGTFVQPPPSEPENFAFSRRRLGSVSFVSMRVLTRVPAWDTELGDTVADSTALEKCFCSQAAWQKWRLVQAPPCLSQAINFSPINKITQSFSCLFFLKILPVNSDIYILEKCLVILPILKRERVPLASLKGPKGHGA